MSQPLAPYPDYKPAGLPWLDKVPTHWDMTSNSRLFRVRKDTVGSAHNDYTLLSLTLKGVIPRDLENAKGKFPAEFDTYQRVQPGNFIFCLFDIDETPRTVGLALQPGMITGAYTVLNCLQPEATQYLHYYYLYLDSLKLLKPLYTGLRKVIKKNTFLSLKTPFPPLPEQQLIVAFLDGKTRQIARLLRHKRQLIKLLNEQKQALIHRAVTQGLDADAPRKDSGVAWLGEVPASWEVKKVKQLVSRRLQYGANEEATDENPEHPRYIRITDFGDAGVLRKNTFKSLSPEKAANYLLKEGDILFARSGATVGKAFLFKNYTGAACFAGYLIKASANTKEILPDFLYLCTQSSFYNQWKSSVFIQTTIQNISAEKYGSLMLPVPSLKEQQEIILYVSKEADLIDQTISRAQREIELIQEYRTRLIADVVTGRVDVRHLSVTAVLNDVSDLLDEETGEEESEEELLLENEDGRD